MNLSNELTKKEVAFLECLKNGRLTYAYGYGNGCGGESHKYFPCKFTGRYRIEIMGGESRYLMVEIEWESRTFFSTRHNNEYVRYYDVSIDSLFEGTVQ